jgi:hypothetical protein
MIFWLVLKLRISYRVMISWRILIYCSEIFWRLYFYMVKYLNFHIFFFCLKIFFLCKWQGHSCVTHPLFQKALQWQQTTYSQCRQIIYYLFIIYLFIYLFIIIGHVTCPPSTIQKILIYLFIYLVHINTCVNNPQIVGSNEN